MSLNVTCYYCGAKKKLNSGALAKLSCDVCSSSRVILDKTAVFKCVLCGTVFEVPAGKRVSGFHDHPECRGRALILLDY